jgi:hypothetical protein
MGSERSCCLLVSRPARRWDRSRGTGAPAAITRGVRAHTLLAALLVWHPPHAPPAHPCPAPEPQPRVARRPVHASVNVPGVEPCASERWPLPSRAVLHLLPPLRRPPRLEGGGWQLREARGQCEVRLQPRAGARVRVRVLSRSVGWLQRAQTVSRTSWRRWNWTTTRI